MKGWIKFGALVLAFTLTIYLTSYISRLPESNCSTEPASSSWSDDHAYKATLLRKNCNLGETVFYSFRIDKPEAWFFKQEIEEDPWPAQASEPTVKWNFHQLEIGIPAKTLTGSIERRIADDLEVVRSYVPPQP